MKKLESLIIYNLQSGSQQLNESYFYQFGIPAVSFIEFLLHGSELVTPDVQNIIVAGGDGTFFSVTRMLAHILPETAAVSVLAFGTGSENVAANMSGTVHTPGQENSLVEQFLAGDLAVKTLMPFHYQTPDKQSDLGFWSLGVGAIGPIILKNLEDRRSMKDPTWRKTMATLAMLLQSNNSRPIAAETNDGSRTTGWDVAYISHNFPFWPNFLNVARSCQESPQVSHDYLLRFGKEDQTRAQTYAGLLLDFAAIHFLGKPATGTVHVKPVIETSLQISAPGRILAIDSEVIEQQASGVATINRTLAKKSPQLSLASVKRTQSQRRY